MFYFPGLPGKLKPLPTGYEQPDDDVHYLGGLLLKHIVQLVSNAHAVTEILEHEDGSTEQVRRRKLMVTKKRAFYKVGLLIMGHPVVK